MSDGFAMSERTGVTCSEKKNSAKKRLLTALVVFFIILIAYLTAYLVIFPSAVPAQIQFVGLKTLRTETLLSELQLTSGKTWLTFDAALASRILSANPVIEDLSIEKKLPDKVVISITERVPAAVALVNIDNKTVPVQIDKNGVIFRIDEGMPVGNVPIISGLTFEQPRTGVRLHAKLRPLMERLAEIQKNNPAYFAAISEIQIAAKEYGNYDLILYPMRSKIRVLADRSLNDDALNYMIVVLDVLNSLEKNIVEVDLRHGAISYKTADGGQF